MLCACSGERFPFEDAPQSPESLATRDFSVSGLSSRTGDWGPKFDADQVDDTEQTLRDCHSLNYEEARALLGRLEYQMGNFDAALHVFEGIDVRGLRPRIVKAISESYRPRKTSSRGDISEANAMSMHSVSLLLEAILLKAKSLEELGRPKDAASECKTIFDIVESAWLNGVPEGIEDECKVKDMFHKAVELLPKLWKQAGILEEAIAAYRRALIKDWKLDSQRLSCIQKELATTLLYGGTELKIPLKLQQVWGTLTPKSTIEEAILLLLILMRKAALEEISWDPEVMNHLVFALTLSGQHEILASHVEQVLPGIYTRSERWYILALCYSAAGMTDTALNVLRKTSGHSEQHKPHLQSLLLGAKLCHGRSTCASEGAKFALRALNFACSKNKHFVGTSSFLLGVCYGYWARTSISDSQRLRLQNDALKLLQSAASLEKNDANVIYSIGLENAVQNKLGISLEYATKYIDFVAGSSTESWRLIALLMSADQNMKEAEGIVDIAIDEIGKDDQMELLRLKAILQVAQEQPKRAIDTYRIILAMIQAHRELQTWTPDSEVKKRINLEMEVWLDLSSIYTTLGSWNNSTICLSKAKSAGYFCPKYWHSTGMLLEAQSLHEEAIIAFLTSLSMEPSYVPSMVSMAAVLRAFGGNFLPIARSFLMSALHLEPTNHNAWLNLGLVAKAEGSVSQAADCFQAAYELRQTSPVQKYI